MESSNAKEKMATAWTATTASAKKDKYIREKKRIAVGLDDQAMAREVSDAYDLSLQEWKAALKELQDMEAHGIPTGHPIFTDNKATADLRESAFNAYLARASEKATARATNTIPRVLPVARDAGILPVDENNDDAALPPLVITAVEYLTPPSRTTSIVDIISSSSTSFHSSNND